MNWKFWKRKKEPSPYVARNEAYCKMVQAVC